MSKIILPQWCTYTYRIEAARDQSRSYEVISIANGDHATAHM